MRALLSISADAYRFARIAAGAPRGFFQEFEWFDEWRRTLRPGANPMQDEQPWMTFAAIAFLRSWLKPEMRVFEWGSGGSTVFFAKRVAEVVAVENDATWAAAVSAACAERGLRHATVLHLPLEEGPAAGDSSDPAGYASSGVPGNFRRYASHIDSFPDAYFDLVSVDGRARPSCFRHALPKVKPGGVLLLDNAERPHYATARRLATSPEWEFRDFSGAGPYNSDGWGTVIWIRRAT